MAGSALPSPRSTDHVVLLRPWRAADVPAMVDAFRDPWFRRFSDWAPDTPDEALAYQRQCEQYRLLGTRVAMAVADAADPDVVLGGVTLDAVDRAQGRAAVGYWLAAEARGRGAASRAVRLLVGWAFAELGLARIELTCGPDNHASQRVAQRCGFRREGVLRSHVPFKGGRRDTVVFGLLPGELSRMVG